MEIMAKKMLIDATHAEETRVVVVEGNKVEEFDFESENRRQLAGNIYLAKVKKFEKQVIDTNKEEFKKYIVKQNSKNKNSLLKSYDTFLNDKYDVSLNQQTIERVKNYFK